MSSDSRKLTQTEINFIIKDVDKKYILEIYRSLKNSIISSKTSKKDLKFIRENIIKYINDKNTPRQLTGKRIRQYSFSNTC